MGELEPEECVQPDWYRLLRARPTLGMTVREIMAWEPFERDWWIDRAIAAENIHGRVEQQHRAWQTMQRPPNTTRH